MPEDFLNGKIAIEVKTLEESRYLINLARGQGYPKEYCDPMFEVDTYLEYPYYFIEDGCQLQANMHRYNVEAWCDEVCTFDTIFGELK
jgi:hypothetical protein